MPASLIPEKVRPEQKNKKEKKEKPAVWTHERKRQLEQYNPPPPAGKQMENAGMPLNQEESL